MKECDGLEIVAHLFELITRDHNLDIFKKYNSNSDLKEMNSFLYGILVSIGKQEDITPDMVCN